MVGLWEELVRRRGVEPEWTAVADGGVGFVAAELGGRLTVEDNAPDSVLLRAEVRFAPPDPFPGRREGMLTTPKS